MNREYKISGTRRAALNRVNAEYLKLELKRCPHCGSTVSLVIESKAFSKRHQKYMQYARVVCDRNRPENGFNRCFCKTTAGPIDEIVIGWERRSRV